MVFNFGFKASLFKKRKAKEPMVKILKYTTFSEEFQTISYIPESRIDKNDASSSNETISNKNQGNMISSITVNSGDKRSPVSQKEKVNPAAQPVLQNIIMQEHSSSSKSKKHKESPTTSLPIKKMNNTSTCHTKEVQANPEVIVQKVSGSTEEFKKSTLIYMTENHDDSNNSQSFKIHTVQHRRASSESEKSYQSADTLELDADSRLDFGYSSQAASIFFGDDLDPQPLLRTRNIKFGNADNHSRTSQTSA